MSFHIGGWTARRAAVAGLLLLDGSGRLIAVGTAPGAPPGLRGDPAMERMGLHSAGSIRTLFWNYGMIEDFPADPNDVDLSVFHSVGRTGTAGC